MDHDHIFGWFGIICSAKEQLVQERKAKRVASAGDVMDKGRGAQKGESGRLA